MLKISSFLRPRESKVAMDPSSETKSKLSKDDLVKMSSHWHILPVFGDIMMIVGLESLDTLHTCRQVCRSWNEIIVSIDILQSIFNSLVSVRDYEDSKVQEEGGGENRCQVD